MLIEKSENTMIQLKLFFNLQIILVVIVYIHTINTTEAR